MRPPRFARPVFSPGAWPFALLVLLMLLPSGFVLWFMNEAVTTQTEAARRSVLEAADPFSIRASGYAFLEEMVFRVHRTGARIAEVPIVFEERRGGESKIGTAEIYRAAWHVLATSLRRRPTAP